MILQFCFASGEGWRRWRRVGTLKVLILAAAAVAHFSENLRVDALAASQWRQRVLYPGKCIEHTRVLAVMSPIHTVHAPSHKLL